MALALALELLRLARLHLAVQLRRPLPRLIAQMDLVLHLLRRRRQLLPQHRLSLRAAAKDHWPLRVLELRRLKLEQKRRLHGLRLAPEGW